MSKPTPGEVRPSDGFRRSAALIYGPVRAVHLGRALEDTVAVRALARTIDAALKATTPASGATDLRAVAAQVVDAMARNQRTGPEPSRPGRAWGGVLRGEAAAPPGLRAHPAGRVERAVEQAGAVDALSSILDAGLTETTRGTGRIDLEALAAYALRAMRGTP